MLSRESTREELVAFLEVDFSALAPLLPTDTQASCLFQHKKKFTVFFDAPPSTHHETPPHPCAQAARACAGTPPHPRINPPITPTPPLTGIQGHSAAFVVVCVVGRVR